jgi:hypothetical protein
MNGALVLDHRVLDAITVSGGLFGTLGSLYLTDELLEKRHVALRVVAIFLTFGTPFGVVFALLGGWPLGILACVVPGAWMAARVLGHMPGGLSVIGLVLWTAALGGVVWFVYGEAAGLWAAATALLVGALCSFVIARRARAPLKTPRRRRVARIAGGVVLAVGGAIGIDLGVYTLRLVSLLTPLWPVSLFVVLVFAVLVGALSAVGPFLVDWIGRLPKGQLGAIGLLFILLGFLAQSCAPLTSLLGIAPH